MRGPGLPVGILEDVGGRTVEDSGPAAGEAGGVAAGLDALAAGLEAEDLDLGVTEERGERAQRVRASSDAGADGVRQPVELVEELFASLEADDVLERAHHRRKRVRTGHGPDDVVGVAHIGDRKSTRLNSSHVAISYA